MAKAIRRRTWPASAGRNLEMLPDGVSYVANYFDPFPTIPEMQVGPIRSTFWRDHHGPLVVSHMKILRLRRYVQTTALSDELAQEAIRVSRNALKSNFDGCAELWWDSLEELAAVRSSPEGAKALAKLLDDENRFLDLSQSQLWYGVEREISDMSGISTNEIKPS